MTQNTDNLRVRRMQKLLREALLDLIEERGFDALTVSEIIQQAMVSRTAFYRHYQDKYDLVEQIFEEALSTLFKAVDEPGLDHPASVWVRFFDHIAQYDRLYRALLGKKGSPWFVQKMRARLTERITEHRSGEGGHGPSMSAHAAHPAHPAHLAQPFSDPFVLDLVAALFVEAITWWLEQGQPYTSKEVATKTARLAASVFREASTWP